MNLTDPCKLLGRLIDWSSNLIEMTDRPFE